jgi:peptidoglycan hydrolase CwlO-like protein
MKTCANCETELKTSLDEYGPANAPLCRSCFLEGKAKIPSQIQKLEDEIEEIEEEISGIEGQIEDLEREKYDLERDVRNLRTEIKELKNPKRAPQTQTVGFAGLPLLEA